MSKLTLKEALILEDAKGRRKDLKYQEVETKKVVTRVIVELAGTESAALTKIAKTFLKIDQAIKKMGVKHKQLSAELKGQVESLYDAEDAVLTRVVETASFILTLSKQMRKEPSVKYDYEKIAEELRKLVDPTLSDKVDLIYNAFKEEIPGGPGKEPTLGVAAKVTESFSDTYQRAIAKFKKLVSTVTKSIASWAVGYDKKLNQLKKQLA